MTLENGSVKIEMSDRVATLRVSGLVSAYHLVETINRAYPSFRQRNVLWDLSGADVGRMSVEDLAIIAVAAKKYPARWGDRRTAFVVSDPTSEERIARHLEHAVLVRVAAQYRVFGDEAAARAWLESP